MAVGQLNGVIQRLGRLLSSGSVTAMDEGQLLDRFVATRDEAAFEALVARHGPMVLGVCRQFLQDSNDVEDAFQATFLVLVRKAATLRNRHLLGNWLYGVAYRVAIRARAIGARRHATETTGVEELAVDRELASHEPRPWLHEEIHRLPEKYRVPVVLCYLEGMTHEEAADLLRWPLGTVKGRLSRARDLLRSRLTRRGLALPIGLLTLNQAGDALAVVPAALVQSTIKAAIAVAAGQSAASTLISTQAVVLSEGVLSTMLLTKLKAGAVTLLVAGAVVATGAGVFARQEPSEEKTTSSTALPTDPGATEAKAKDVVFKKARKKAQPKSAQNQATEPETAAPGAMPGMMGPGGGMMGGGGMGGMMGGGGMGGMMGAPGGMGGRGFGGVGGNNPQLVMQVERGRRVLVAKMVSQLEEEDRSPKSAAILKKLEEPIVMSFSNETPFEDVLKYIKTATTGKNDTGIPIYVDPAGLKEVEATFTSPIVIDLEGVPLKTTLRLVLKQLRLAYCVKDGLLMISSVNGIYWELQEAGIKEPVEDQFQ